MDPRRPRARGGVALRLDHRPRALHARPRSALHHEAYAVEGFAFGVNYGYDRVRFPAPLPVDSRVRMRATLESVDDVPGGIQMKVAQTFEREGGDKPVCVAEQLVRLYTGG